MGKVRQKIDSLIDYCGDIARNSGGAGPRVYSEGYSPNNIRRVVISPNGVLVVYHKANQSTGGRSYNFVEFPERELYMEEQEQSYKPILRLLAVPLVCSCLEEIVVLSNSLTGNVHPNYLSEIQLETMVASFKGAGSDLQTKISNRYKRLRYYTVMNVNFKEFMNYFGAAVRSKEAGRYSFFSEMPGFQSRSQITELAGSDYWRYYGVQTSTYALDSVLEGHFSAIRQRREKEDKSKAVDAMREKRLGSKIQVVNALISEYALFNRLWSQYYNIVRHEGTNGVLADLGFVKQPDTFQVSPFRGMCKVPERLMSKQQCGDAEALEKNESQLKGYKARCAGWIVHDFLTALDGVRNLGEETLLRVIVDGCETSISVPTSYSSLVKNIQDVTGVSFSGRDINATISICCSQFLRYFVDCGHTEPFSKEYWEGKLRKGV